MRNRAFSLLDLVTILVCSFVFTSLAAIRVQRYRGAARGNACSENLRKIGVAAHNYHDTFRVLPMGSGGTNLGVDDDPRLGNANRLSPLVGLLPYLEQMPLWEQISQPMQSDDGLFPSMGPVPWYDPAKYKPWGQRPSVSVCPADSSATQFSTASSYVINYGDAVLGVGAPLNREFPPYVRDAASKRGAFIREYGVRIREFVDGTSNTLLFSEAKIGGLRVARDVDGLALDPSICVSVRSQAGTAYWPDGRKACWADGSLRSLGFQTILPPNLPSATSKTGELEGVMSASSHHAGGVHVLFADASVQFVTDTIDAGDSRRPSVAMPRNGRAAYAPPGSPSPYGLWGALGTRNSHETVNRRDDNIVDPPQDMTAEELAEIESRPLKTWRTEKGEPFRARQIGLEREARVVLLTESGETRRIALSTLRSEDAYHAVKTHVDQMVQMRRDLETQLEEALKLLEQRKYEAFHETFVDPSKNKSIEDVKRYRGLTIYAIDGVLKSLRATDASRSLRWYSSDDILFGGDNLRLRRSGRRWLIQL